MLGRPGQEPITRGGGLGRVLAWIGAAGLLLGGAGVLWLQNQPEASPFALAESAAAEASQAADAAARAADQASAAANPGSTFTQSGSSPVIDGAKLFSEDAISRMGFKLDELRRVAGPRVVVMTVPSMGGTPIKDYSIRISNQWGIGDAQRNDGVLLLLAPKEKQVRIAVGKGLEAVLTDALCKKIIDERMLPHFRKGNMEAAAEAGVDALAEVLGAHPTLPRKVPKP